MGIFFENWLLGGCRWWWSIRITSRWWWKRLWCWLQWVLWRHQCLCSGGNQRERHLIFLRIYSIKRVLQYIPSIYFLTDLQRSCLLFVVWITSLLWTNKEKFLHGVITLMGSWDTKLLRSIYRIRQKLKFLISWKLEKLWKFVVRRIRLMGSSK